MDVLELWGAWYQAFEQCAIDDQWERLGPLLADDVQYRVTGVPFACTLKGRDAVIAGFARSFANFDRRFDKRAHQVIATRVHAPGHIEARIRGVYEKAGLPTLAFPAIGHWHADGAQIGLMVDVYDPDLLESQTAFAWLEQHGPGLGGLDPSYG